MLIGVTGEKGSGKDTFAKGLEGFVNLKMADPLKNMLRVLLEMAGIDADTTERMIEGDLKEIPCDALCGKTPRFAMQTLGTEWRDMIGKELWSNIWLYRLKGGNIVCTDVRFLHEAAAVQDRGGIIVRVERPGLAGDGDTHVSETEMQGLIPDFVVVNSGSPEELQQAARGFIK